MNRLKLEIELVPHDSWGRNLRTQVRKSVWDKIRKEAYANAEASCEVCESVGKLSCHEVWECDDAAATQQLKCFQAVCGMCHHVNHYGMSTVLWRQGRLDLEAVDRHFLAVNQVGPAVLAEHKKEAGRLFLRRANVTWRIDFGPWQGLWEEEQKLLKGAAKTGPTH